MRVISYITLIFLFAWFMGDKAISRAKSIQSKIKDGMGTGSRVSYKPFITTSEFNSLGTTAVIKDWKTGRGVHCLSQGEVLWYYILRWDDQNLDIREQIPLNMNEIKKIADSLNVDIPKAGAFIMTTDFLVERIDGAIAYSIKNDRNLTQRTLELLCIEKMYWVNQGIEFKLLFKEDVNRILSTNIRIVTEFYDEKNIFDEISKIKHLIAIKYLICDLETKLLDTTYLRKISKCI